MAAMVWQRACLPRLRCDDCIAECSDSPVLSLYFPGILAALHGSKVPIFQGWGGYSASSHDHGCSFPAGPCSVAGHVPRNTRALIRNRLRCLPNDTPTHTYIRTHTRTHTHTYTDACVHGSAKPMQRQSSPPSDHLLHRCHDNCKQLPHIGE